MTRGYNMHRYIMQLQHQPNCVQVAVFAWITGTMLYLPPPKSLVFLFAEGLDKKGAIKTDEVI